MNPYYSNPGGWYNNQSYQSQLTGQVGGYLRPVQNYDPVALQMRIVKARQVNLMCKQHLVRNVILGGNNSQPSSNYDNSNGQQQSQPPRIAPAPSATQPFERGIRPVERPQVERRQSESLPSTPLALEPTQRERKRVEEPSERRYSEEKNEQEPRNKPIESDRDGKVPSRHKQQFNNDEEDDSIPIDQSATLSRQKSGGEEIKLLNTLAESMNKTVEDSNSMLKKLNAKKNKLPEAEKVKKRIENLIKVNATSPTVLPLWRHKLNGNPNPAPETVLKGKRLFRVIVKSLLNMFIKPTIMKLKRTMASRESERRDLQRSLKLISDSFDDWIGKLVHLPVSSVVQVR